MVTPDRQGSFVNTFIWCGTLVAIAALTIWRFDIWPVLGLATRTGSLEKNQSVATESLATGPITIAGGARHLGERAKKTSSRKPDADDAPQPAKLAQLEIMQSLQPIPQPSKPDWQSEAAADSGGGDPGKDGGQDPDSSSPSDGANDVAGHGLHDDDASPGSASEFSPTGSDFGGGGLFPKVSQPMKAAPRNTPEPSAPDAAAPAGDNAAVAPIPTAAAMTATISPVSGTTTAGTTATASTTNAVPSEGDAGAAALPATSTPTSLAEIKAEIADGHYLAAHRALSLIYWNKPEQRDEIQQEIELTAKTIYFDPETRLVPTESLDPNSSLADLAQRFQVPVGYLGRVNGIEHPDQLQNASDLKVVMGPFGAVLNTDGHVLTIHAHGYYVRQIPCEAHLKKSAGKPLFLSGIEGDTLTVSSGYAQASDNPFADPPQPAGTIELSQEDAGLVADLLAPGAEIAIRE